MLMPKRVKYRKQFRGRMKGMSFRGNKLEFGDFALQAVECSWVSSRQIEACRKAIRHHMRREGKLWIRIFPDKPISKKPLEVKMGGGKGQTEEWVAVVKPGRILFEIQGVSEEMAREGLRRAMHKLPMKSTFIAREERIR